MGDERHHSAYIILHGPEHDGTRLVLREGITSFGRLPSNDVILLGDLVSRHHTRITFFEGRATIQDLGSHNGSWVNGEKVSTRLLKDGDICRIGNFRLSFHAGPPPSNGQPSFEETTNAEPGQRRMTDRTPTSSVDRTGKAPSASILLQQIEMARTGQGAQAKAMQVLLRASDALAAATDLESYMQQMLHLALDQTGASTAAFIRRDDKTGELHQAAVRTAQRNVEATVAMRVVTWTVTKNFGVLSDDVATDLRFEGDRVAGPLAALCVPVVDADRVLGAMYLARRSPPFHDGDLDVVSAVAHLTATAMTRAQFLRQQTTLNADALSKLSSPDIAKVLREQLDVPEPTGFEGKRATIVIADIPGLSSLSERTSPTEISTFLSRFLERAHDVALRHKGAMRALTGARLMLLFGAPYSYGEDAARAVASALELRAVVEQEVARFAGIHQTALRVGAASGWLLAGPIGTKRRMTYAVLGDVVELASTLERRGAPGSIVVDEATAQLVTTHVELRKIADRPSRDRPAAAARYEVMGRKRR